LSRDLPCAPSDLWDSVNCEPFARCKQLNNSIYLPLTRGKMPYGTHVECIEKDLFLFCLPFLSTIGESSVRSFHHFGKMNVIPRLTRSSQLFQGCARLLFTSELFYLLSCGSPFPLVEFLADFPPNIARNLLGWLSPYSNILRTSTTSFLVFSVIR
jgi:hypothetical protein